MEKLRRGIIFETREDFWVEKNTVHEWQTTENKVKIQRDVLRSGVFFLLQRRDFQVSKEEDEVFLKKSCRAF